MINKTFFSMNKRFFLIIFLLFINNKVYSNQDPVLMLQNITTNVINTLNDKEEIMNEDNEESINKEVYNIINKYIIPNIDLVEMSRWIMGKIVWQKSTKEEKNKFINAFKYLLIGHYYITLNDYKKHDLKFLPIQEKELDGKKFIIVKSTINNKTTKKTLYIDYRLINRNGQWKVYDIVVEGVSLLKAYQAQLKNRIRKYGLKKVTDEILSSNQIKYVN
jgi:phospholipid transport system substrate-binding protein